MLNLLNNLSFASFFDHRPSLLILFSDMLRTAVLQITLWELLFQFVNEQDTPQVV